VTSHGSSVALVAEVPLGSRSGDDDEGALI